MYSEELEKEIFDRLDRKRDLIHKKFRTRLEDERQKATMQFNKDVEERGISIFSISSEESPEEFAVRIIDFIEKQTGFKIECAVVTDLSDNRIYVRVNRK